MRIVGPVSLAALLCTGLPAAAAQSDVTAVLSDCGASDLPPSTLDSCLERVRVLNETSPSPELASLEARLEETKHGKDSVAANGPPKALQPLQEETVASDPAVPAAAPPPPPDEVGATAGQSAQTAEAGPPQSESAQVEDRSGPQADVHGANEQSQGSFDSDEPPIADPPDGAPGTQPDDPG